MKNNQALNQVQNKRINRTKYKNKNKNRKQVNNNKIRK